MCSAHIMTSKLFIPAFLVNNSTYDKTAYHTFKNLFTIQQLSRAPHPPGYEESQQPHMVRSHEQYEHTQHQLDPEQAAYDGVCAPAPTQAQEIQVVDVGGHKRQP